MNTEKIALEQADERAALIALATMEGATFANVPGRYDGASDRRLAQALDVLDADEEAGSVETTGAHLARFGRFIRKTDEQGFVDVLTFASLHAAIEQMAIVADVEAQLGDFSEEVIPTVTEASATLAEKADLHEKLAGIAALDALIDQQQQSDARLRML